MLRSIFRPSDISAFDKSAAAPVDEKQADQSAIEVGTIHYIYLVLTFAPLLHFFYSLCHCIVYKTPLLPPAQ